ncbi:hypothetical protein EV13_2359 [Prochlorococcus sp. MIT 0702]|nr:hypothetical protein EV12_1921 [Prochlorococcus sp. MIT 0701]KGG26898.1 hypothetical protein EV13_2359 [Prochlorococcus sp. MIT 0702]KGG36174.1 hypothetical protein EV14_0583 [Prochlorococcus sp. MIT 0703]
MLFRSLRLDGDGPLCWPALMALQKVLGLFRNIARDATITTWC